MPGGRVIAFTWRSYTWRRRSRRSRSLRWRWRCPGSSRRGSPRSLGMVSGGCVLLKSGVGPYFWKIVEWIFWSKLCFGSPLCFKGDSLTLEVSDGSSLIFQVQQIVYKSSDRRQTKYLSSTFPSGGFEGSWAARQSLIGFVSCRLVVILINLADNQLSTHYILTYMFKAKYSFWWPKQVTSLDRTRVR